MAPLDTGSVMDLRLVEPLGERVGPSPKDYEAVGLFLRALREHRGLTLHDVADTTRIRRAYLQGIEEGDRSVLPARPFAIGYVRAYAQALGVDGDAAAARFKREMPELDEPFRDPVGVRHEKKQRNPLIFAVVALVVSGVVLWNLVQRATIQDDRQTAPLPVAADAPATPTNTTVAVSAATPAPAAQTLPPPYKVPGLDAPAPQMRGGVPIVQADGAAVAGGPAADMPLTFQPQGAVFGAPAGSAAMVVLQARKPASLIVRGSGAVYFARQLAAGEAYRAPQGQGLTAEVVDPAAIVLYVSGQNKGVLVSQQTALDKLGVPPPPTVAAAPAPSPVGSRSGAPGAAPSASGQAPVAAASAAVHANVAPRRSAVTRVAPPSDTSHPEDMPDLPPGHAESPAP